MVNTVWGQVVGGMNYLIQCTSDRGVFATVKIFVPGPWTGESPRITWSGQGHRTWRNYDDKPMPGGWSYGDVERSDRRFVSKHFDAICKGSKVNAGSWTVNECQSQVVNGVNYSYTISSDCGAIVTADFFKATNQEDAQLVRVNLG